MLRFYAHRFTDLLHRIGYIDGALLARIDVSKDSPTFRTELAKEFRTLESLCIEIGLEQAATRAAKIAAKLDEGWSVSSHQIVSLLPDMAERIHDGLRTAHIFAMTPAEVAVWEPTVLLFGVEVGARFPKMSEDIAEAGKCLAVGRWTACVFHLMRVMELGVQQIGDLLGVTSTAEKYWGPLTDEIGGRVSRLDKNDPRKPPLSAAVSHLHSVRVAWRNEVMHPRQTYAEEEARDIFTHTRSFIRSLLPLV
jgi:hypothetical protein